jgi:hypothetical protein
MSPTGGRTSVWWLAPAIAVAGAGYLILHGFQDYQGGSQACAIRAAQRGLETIPDACRFPIRAILLGVLILVVGWRVGGWLRKA